MRPIQIILSFCLITGIILSGCAPKASLKDEGTIIYDIVYAHEQQANISNKTLPKRMVVKYQNHKLLNQIEGMGGMVTLTYIQDKDQNISHYLVKLLNKKIYYTDTLGEITTNFMFSDSSAITITPSHEKKEILGYICNSATIEADNSDHTKFTIYYTNEIGQPNPNQNTPFEPIKGIMLEFGMILSNVHVKLVANSIEAGGIDSTTFAIPEEFKKMDKETLLEVFKLFNQ
jgi:hypothetical protein